MPHLRSFNLWGLTVLAAVVALVSGMVLGGSLQRYEHSQATGEASAPVANSSLFDASDKADEVELGVGWHEEAEDAADMPEVPASVASAVSASAR